MPRIQIWFIFFSNLSLFTYTFAQHDTFPNHTPIKKQCLIYTATGHTLSTVGSLFWLSKQWYSPYATGTFHFFNDASEWGKMDKLGHAFTVFHLSSFVQWQYAWCNVSPTTSLLLGTFIPYTYLSIIEIMDGFSEGWGFSWADIAANTAGTGLYLLQQKYPLFQLKFSYHKSLMATQRPQIFGKNLAENILKDYNGQVYWLCIIPWYHTENPFKYFNIAVGYSIDNYFYAKNNPQPALQWYLSFDVNLNRIPTQKKALKMLFSFLDIIKMPTPAVMWSNSRFHFSFSGY